jgi:hypothetical protein
MDPEDAQKLNNLDALIYNSATKQLMFVDNLLTPNFKVLSGKAEKDALQIKDTKVWFLNHIRSVVAACCKGQVSEQYISDHQTLCHIFILFRNNKNNEIVGFITSYTRGAGGEDYFIDVICSTGYGKYQLKFFTDFFFLHGGAKSVSLAALPHVLYYYKKFGYAHKHSCAEAPFTQPDFGKNTPKTMENAFARPNFKQYMSDLQTHGFSAKKYLKRFPDGSVADVCKSPIPLSAEDLQDCAINGFYMKHCLNDDYSHDILQDYSEIYELPRPLRPYGESYSTRPTDLAISGQAMMSGRTLRSRVNSSHGSNNGRTSRSRFGSNSSGYGSNNAVNGNGNGYRGQNRKRTADNAHLSVPNNVNVRRRSRRLRY